MTPCSIDPVRPVLDRGFFEDFVDIKLDARNLIEADVKSALTDLDWFGKARFPALRAR